MALSIFRFCFSHGIALEAQWIPRSLNERADLLTRFVDKDDWRLNPSVFRLVDAKWGPHRLTASLPIITLSFRVLTPSLLHLVAAVSMPWCRRALVRGRSISLTRPSFTVAQISECWLCVWILGKFFLTVSDSVLILFWHILSLI